MLSVDQIAAQQTSTYAVGVDFCRIFNQEMDRLYLLSFLLTADQAKAEECFAAGLEDSAKSNRVFKDWASSWARRMIVQNAIGMIRPQPTDSTESNRQRVLAVQPEIAVIVELPAFERFAFVMSVLERYSDQECSLLLDRTRAEVSAARTRALQQIGRSPALHLKPVNIAATEQAHWEHAGSALQQGTVAQLAASA